MEEAVLPSAGLCQRSYGMSIAIVRATHICLRGYRIPTGQTRMYLRFERLHWDSLLVGAISDIGADLKNLESTLFGLLSLREILLTIQVSSSI
jgi:hypothetical protein